MLLVCDLRMFHLILPSHYLYTF
uniref:Uncharacterized protein n=1 Tax=Arundo donax TaxID=35708 RepID=A0A0A9C1B8_ARUDO